MTIIIIMLMNNYLEYFPPFFIIYSKVIKMVIIIFRMVFKNFSKAHVESFEIFFEFSVLELKLFHHFSRTFSILNISHAYENEREYSFNEFVQL